MDTWRGGPDPAPPPTIHPRPDPAPPPTIHPRPDPAPPPTIHPAPPHLSLDLFGLSLIHLFDCIHREWQRQTRSRRHPALSTTDLVHAPAIGEGGRGWGHRLQIRRHHLQIPPTPRCLRTTVERCLKDMQSTTSIWTSRRHSRGWPGRWSTPASSASSSSLTSP